MELLWGKTRNVKDKVAGKKPTATNWAHNNNFFVLKVICVVHRFIANIICYSYFAVKRSFSVVGKKNWSTLKSERTETLTKQKVFARLHQIWVAVCGCQLKRIFDKECQDNPAVTGKSLSVSNNGFLVCIQLNCRIQPRREKKKRWINRSTHFFSKIGFKKALNSFFFFLKFPLFTHKLFEKKKKTFSRTSTFVNSVSFLFIFYSLNLKNFSLSVIEITLITLIKKQFITMIDSPLPPPPVE